MQFSAKMKPGSIIQLDWHSSREGADILRALVDPNTYQRQQFGFLEKPNLPPNIKEIGYKIFVCGKPGVGKTRTIAQLVGTKQATSYQDISGIHVTATYWPVRLIMTSKILLFRLEFWDAGGKKFDHVLPSCKEEADAILFLFSFTDRASFEEIPKQMQQVLQTEDKTCTPIIVGTQYDSHVMASVTLKDVNDFEQQWNTSVIKLKNNLPESLSRVLQRAVFSETAVALSMICEQLWHKDQSLLGVDL